MMIIRHLFYEKLSSSNDNARISSSPRVWLIYLFNETSTKTGNTFSPSAGLNISTDQKHLVQCKKDEIVSEK